MYFDIHYRQRDHFLESDERSNKEDCLWIIAAVENIKDKCEIAT